MEEHIQDCASIEGDHDYSKECGVNSRSLLLELEHFDMCSGALLPDVMHDLLEGSLQHIVMLIIHYLTKTKKYFSLKHLNQKIEGMELGYMEENRPSPVSRKDKTLRQNGNLPELKVIVNYSIPL